MSIVKEGGGKSRPRLVVASDNAGKLIEFSMLFPEFDVYGMREAGFMGDIEETGSTFIENAGIKAKAVFDAIGGLVIADDSGLAVDRLDGAPGVYSARFAGAASTYDEKFQALWKLLAPFSPEEWTASFVAVHVVILPDGTEDCFEGRLDGLILPEKRGEGGFGYDPVFFVPEYGLTVAELTPEVKNKISHRGRAAKQARSRLVEALL